MIHHFNTPIADVPTVWIDTETTGVRPGIDRAVQIGICRYEGGKVVGEFESHIYPGRGNEHFVIPAEATEIHGITNDMVIGAPQIESVMASPEVRALLADAQPAGYNCGFDRNFIPPFGDWTWPWLDCLTLVRVTDRYAKGKGRHKLTAACERHGIKLAGAHTALADARASGALFFKLIDLDMPLGEVLAEQMKTEAEEWFRFNEWLSRQPPKENINANA